MRTEASKADWRQVLNGFTAVLVVALTLVAIGANSSLLMAVGYFLLLGGLGFVLARLWSGRGEQVPVPRGLRRRWGKGTFRRAAADQPFHTRLGWTEGSEPGGSLPDVRKVTPHGLTGGGLCTDGVVAGLVLAGLFIVLLNDSPIGTIVLLLYVLAYASLGFAMVAFVRWLRQR